MNYWERWVGDWKRKTAHLSAEHKGIYGELLDYLYSAEGALPLNLEAVYRIAGASSTSERRACDSVLAEFMEKAESGYWNKRASQEIEKRRNYVEAQRGRAKRRWEQEPARAVQPKPGNGADGPACITIPLQDGSEYPISDAYRNELDKLYPNVEPNQTLAEIRAWNLSNPAKRKTARGVHKHVNAWFAREQEKHGRTQ